MSNDNSKPGAVRTAFPDAVKRVLASTGGTDSSSGRDKRGARPNHIRNLKDERNELREALRGLLVWVTNGDRSGNPYCKPEVQAALTAYGKATRQTSDPFGVNLDVPA